MVDTTNDTRKGPGVTLPSWAVASAVSLLLAGSGILIAWGSVNEKLANLERQIEYEGSASRKTEDKVNNIYGTLERLDERSRQQQQLLEEIKRRLWAPPERVPM